MPTDGPEPGPTEWSTGDPGVGPWSVSHPGPLPDDPHYDPELLEHGDSRNVVDAYRYWRREAIVADIDTRRHPLHVAIENFGNDANIGAVVRPDHASRSGRNTAALAGLVADPGGKRSGRAAHQGEHQRGLAAPALGQAPLEEVRAGYDRIGAFLASASAPA